jgi:hypothetical protein
MTATLENGGELIAGGYHFFRCDIGSGDKQGLCVFGELFYVVADGMDF